MKIRKNIIPRRYIDGFCSLLALFSIPSIFLFGVCVSLPTVHAPGTLSYMFTFGAAVFLLYSIMGNLLACMLVDTSVNQRLPIAAGATLSWDFCEQCNELRPPRSWHCKVCRTCILKRDHHCLFTACCIGHYNQRYFIMFLIFLLIGSTYAFAYNTYYLMVVNASTHRNIVSLFKILCPILLFFLGTAWQNFYLVLYNVNVLGLIYAVAMLMYHLPTALHGNVCYDRNSHAYDAGWKENLRSVLGKRMHLVWLSPFIRSDLPNDGCFEGKYS